MISPFCNAIYSPPVSQRARKQNLPLAQTCGAIMALVMAAFLFSPLILTAAEREHEWRQERIAQWAGEKTIQLTKNVMEN